MKNWIRLLIPVGFGAMAFTLNAWTMSERLKPELFVRVNADIPAGQPLDRGTLVPIEMFGDLGSMRDVLIPWNDRGIVIGATVRQPLLAGDPVLRMDVEYEPVGSELTEDSLGSGEEGLTIPLGGLSMTPERLMPGDFVKVVLAPTGARRSASWDGNPESLDAQRIIGPFRILRSSELRLTVAIPTAGDSEGLDDQTATLLSAVHGRGFEILGILISESDERKAASFADPAVTFADERLGDERP